MTRKRPCGNRRCSSSTGIHEGITFGSGYLDSNGYFEKPCRVCAADFDARIEEVKQSVREGRLKFGEKPEEVEQYIRTADWLNLPAWPFT